MITDRTNFNFVTICCWASLLAMAMTTTLVTATRLPLQQHKTPPPQQQHQHHQHQQQRQQGQRLIKTSADQDQPDNAAAAEAFGLKHFSNPRIDYNNEWRPVGRGDPLKNDPTYDYSPPALERVRYWADSPDQESAEGLTGNGTGAVKAAAAAAKSEILLLGVAHERPHVVPNTLTNTKGELPLLQPKYTSIRRSYFTQQLPTHLMPPPMQTLMAATYNTNSNNNNNNNNNNVMKSVASATTPSDGEFSRPSLANGLTASSVLASSLAGLPAHSKSYYSTTATTAPWMLAHPHAFHHSPAPAATTIQRPSFDSLQQESAHSAGYSQRPNMRPSAEAHSPNSIRPGPSAVKTPSSPRKPWVHELLQKELIKPVRTTAEYTKYRMESATDASYPGISRATARPVKPEMVAVISASPAPLKLPVAQPISRISSAVPSTSFTSPTPTSSTTQSTASNFSATRLLIPETNNIISRPTVAPIELTTDSLFAHYNQPDKPLIGPMYLIIEGHSKVKTYGKNELDPHQPKIVPIIPKREPIVRVANQNDQRGGVETFQVKHLHTKVAPAITTRTPATADSREKLAAMPTIMKTKVPAEKKVSKPFLTHRTTTVSLEPTPSTTTTKSLVVSKVTTSRPLTPSTTTTASPLGVGSTVDEIRLDQPPTGMQGLLSFLDASFGNIFQHEPLDVQPNFVQRPQPHSSEATKTGGAAAAAGDLQVEWESADRATKSPPRDVRQVFDYDQLPEGRLKQAQSGSSDENLPTNTWTKSPDDDSDYDESQEYFEENIKAMDKKIDYEQDDYVVEGTDVNEEDKEDLESNENEPRFENISNERKNALVGEFNKA